MYKNELKICISFIILAIFIVLCLVCNLSLNRLKNEANIIANKRKEFLRLSQKISSSFFCFRKNKEQLVGVAHDIRKSILEILRSFEAKKVAIKIDESSQETYNLDNIRFQFEIKSEQDVYKFLQSLKLQFNVIFDVIKIVKKSVESFKVEIECRCMELKEIDKEIRIKPLEANEVGKEARVIKKISIFSKNNNVPKHILKGIINGTKAFIDEEWKSVGDSIEDNEITVISDDFVMIETDGVEKQIRIGDFF